MRLDYLVAHGCDLGRKHARSAITAGRVTVDGEVVTRPGHRLPPQASVRLDGEPVSLPEHCYIMLNKPAGVISATRDDRGRTVVDLMPERLRSGLHPAGRLDQDTTGLVLLTTDGEWSHRVTSPVSKLEKGYRVETADPVHDEQLAQLCDGVSLRGESKATLPARAEQLGPTSVRLWIREGRYHQIKRMFGALGNRVVALHRESIGAVVLDADLAPGEYRLLSDEEVTSLMVREDC